MHFCIETWADKLKALPFFSVQQCIITWLFWLVFVQMRSVGEQSQNEFMGVCAWRSLITVLRFMFQRLRPDACIYYICHVRDHTRKCAYVHSCPWIWTSTASECISESTSEFLEAASGKTELRWSNGSQTRTHLLFKTWREEQKTGEGEEARKSSRVTWGGLRERGR